MRSKTSIPDNIIRSKSWKVKTLIIIGVLFTFHFSLLTSAKAQAVLESDTIALGDQTTLSIPFAGDSLPMLDLGKIEVVEQHLDTSSHTLLSTVTCFEPGEHWLHIGPYDSLPLVVTDVEVDTTTAEIRDIAPIQRVPYTFWELFRWVLLAWAVAAVGIVVWYLIDRRKRRGSIFAHHEPVDTRTPEQRALDGLEELRQSHLWQSGQVKEYHTRLTDIVRQFIEEATGIRATEMTSGDIVSSVQRLAFSEATQDIEQLRSIFTTADLVKFAKSEPLPHEHEASMTAAVAFVKQLWESVKPNETADKETGGTEE